MVDQGLLSLLLAIRSVKLLNGLHYLTWRCLTFTLYSCLVMVGIFLE